MGQRQGRAEPSAHTTAVPGGTTTVVALGGGGLLLLKLTQPAKNKGKESTATITGRIASLSFWPDYACFGKEVMGIIPRSILPMLSAFWT